MQPNPDPGIVSPGRAADAPHGRNGASARPADPIDQAIAASAEQLAGIDVGIELANGRTAHLVVPVPLTPSDIVSILMALTDLVAGRVGPAPKPSVRDRLAARGLSIPR